MRRFLLLCCLSIAAGPCLAPPIDAGDGAGLIRFITPGRFATFAGPSTATLEVLPPPGATIVSVAFIVNGAPAGTTSSPPWTFAWEAGDGTKEQKISAIAKFSDGTEARASVTSGRRIVTGSVDQLPVTVNAIARGAKGVHVDDLRPADVRLLENGRPQAVETISAERRPLGIAIVLDASVSMAGEKLKSSVASAVAFLSTLQSGDEALVLSFSDKVSMLQDLTSDRKKLESAIRSVSAKGGSSLYDAIYDASARLAGFDGRRAIVLLADGRDEGATGRVAGSVHTIDQARERALRNDVTVFVIALGGYLSHDAGVVAGTSSGRILEMDVDWRQPVATILSSIAADTGGPLFLAPNAAQIRPAFEQVAEDLRHQYRLVYLSDDTKRDGSWRELKVSADRPGVSLTTKKGYFAPMDPAGRGGR